MAFSLGNHNFGNSGASGSTIANTALAAAVTSTQLVVGAVSWSGTSTLSNVKDNGTPQATYNLLTPALTTAGGINICIFWLYGPTGSPTIFTATLSAAETFRTIYAAEFGTGEVTALIDQQANATGTSATPTGASVTPGVANELIFAGCAEDVGSNPAAGTGFTLIDADVLIFGGTEEQIQTTATIVSAGFTLSPSTSGTWAVVTATFQLQAAAGGGTTTYRWNQAVKI